MLLDSSSVARKIYRTMDISKLLSLGLHKPSYAATACRYQFMSRGKRKPAAAKLSERLGSLNALAIMTYIGMLGDWARKGLRVN